MVGIHDPEYVADIVVQIYSVLESLVDGTMRSATTYFVGWDSPLQSHIGSPRINVGFDSNQQ